jgi:DNA-binding NarL/FixJ family response regulator
LARILIADDNPLMLRVLREVLERHPDWTVCGDASNGLEAVSKAAELLPDLVILDLTMPKLNGIQAGRAIHTAAPDIPLLLFTQHLFEGHVEEEARNNGFSGGIQKGEYGALVAGIEALLRGETFLPSASNARIQTRGDRPPDAVE